MRLLLFASASLLLFPLPILADGITVTASVNSQAHPGNDPPAFCSQSGSTQAATSVSLSISCPEVGLNGKFLPNSQGVTAGTASYMSLASIAPHQFLYEAAEVGPATATSGGIYMNHQGLIPIRVNASGGGSISLSLSETYMFSDPTTVTIDILQLLGGDGEFGTAGRSCSYVFNGLAFTCPQSFENQVDFVKTFAVLPGIQYHFTLNASDDFGSYSGVEGSSDAVTYNVSVANGTITEAPEPASLLLLGTGLLSLVALKKFM